MAPTKFVYFVENLATLLREIRGNQLSVATSFCPAFQCQMLPTPTKLHYSFDTTDLSRVWQGMMHATADVILDAADVLALWKHECCRVIADRYGDTTRKGTTSNV